MGVRRILRIGRSPEREVDEEIAFHFESRVAELVEGGLSPDDARRRAEAEFGDVDEVRRALMSSTRRRAARRAWSERLRDLGDDVGYVLRSVRRAPAFALTVATTLGLGIGATATMYGVVDRLLIRGPEHVVDAASLRRIYAHVRSKASGEFTTSFVGYSTYAALRDGARSVAQTAAYSENASRVGRGVDAAPIELGNATASFFPLLGVRPERGRFFSAVEDAPPDGQNVAVIDDGYWRRELGGDESAIGRTIVLFDKPFTIIGVAPAGFTGAELRPVDVWIPMSAGPHPVSDWPHAWNAQWLNVVVRPKSGASPEAVDADVTASFRAAYGGTDAEWKRADVSARPIAFTAAGEERADAPIARWLAAVALLVLLVGSANVANLLIVRAMRRRHEIAVRLALGISRARLARLVAAESFVYALIGAAIGVGLAYAGGEVMRRVFLPSIAWTEPPVSGRVLAVAALLAPIVGAAIALAPIMHVLATDLSASIRVTGARPGARSSKAKRTLLVIQTALSVALLIGAGLFIRSLWNVRHLDLGVEPERVLVASVGWPRVPNPSPSVAAAERTQRANAYRELRDRIAQLPGVSHAAIAVGSPFGFGFGVDVKVPGRDTLPSAPGGGPYISAVGKDYFATVGTPLVRGRVIGASDGAGTPRVAVVDETMAALLWPNEDPLGKCIVVESAPTCASVVGVVRDAHREGINEPASMQFYIPVGQESGFGGAVLVVRPAGDAKPFTETLRRAIVAAEPSANYLLLCVMQEHLDPQVRPWRLGATMFGLFGALALIVAAVGLYSVIAYSTAQRTHEFGVRLAIGASTGRLALGVVGEAVRIAFVGVAAGGVVALVAGGRVAPLLFHVSAKDPVVFASVAGVLVMASLVASVVPALRASRTDPVIALRSM